MPIKKKKISDLTLADSLKGLYTIGYKVVDGVKTSVKVSLEYIQVAYEDVLKATNDAIAAAKTAFDAATAADTSRKAIEANEAEREGNENARKASEQERAAAEVQRGTAETGRVNAETERVTEFGKLKTDSEKATGDANAAAGRVDESIHNAEVATGEAQVATAGANQAAIEANQSAANADEKAILAHTAAANAEDTANHPTYIGTDHYVYKWNKTTKAYDKTDIYCKGDAFSIKKVYASVAALNADVNSADIVEGDFVLVNTNDVENPDNAKLYVKVKSGSVYSYEFLVDMSGAIGFTGKTPQFSMGNISTLEAGSTATATVSEDGTDSNGNPKYKISFAIPRGNPGAPFRVAGEYETFAALQTAVPNGANVDGFMAVGTKVPYNYYAWVNGAWKDQGQIVAGDNIINMSGSLMNLTTSSTSAEILNVFGGIDKLKELVAKLRSLNCIIVVGDNNGSYTYTLDDYSIVYTDANNFDIHLFDVFTDASNNTYRRCIMINIINNVAKLNHNTKVILLSTDNVADNLTTSDANKVLSAKQGKELNDSTIKINHVKFAKDLDLSELDPNTWYPCSIPLINIFDCNRYNRICISSNLSYTTVGWSTHATIKRITFNADITIQADSGGWMGTVFSTLNNYSGNFGGETAFGGIVEEGIANKLIVYLRGGAKYKYYSFDGNANFTIHANGYVNPSGITKYDAPLKTEQGNPFTGFAYAFEKGGLRTKSGTHTMLDTSYVRNELTSTATQSPLSAAMGKKLNEEKVGSTSVRSIVNLTQAQYDALSTKDSSTLYIIID